MMPPCFYVILVESLGDTEYYGEPEAQESDAQFDFRYAKRKHDQVQVLFLEPSAGVCIDVTDDFVRGFNADPANAEYLRDQAEWAAS